MPSANQFLPFGVGPGDDATPQTEYATAIWRVEGWRSGILPHEQINKVLRQTSTIAAAVAQMVADYTQQSVEDNGNVAAIVNQLKLAISANLPYIEGFDYPVGSLGWAIQSGLAGGVMTAEEIREALTGSLTAEEFSSVINGRLNLIDAPITGLVTRVADLTTAYGTTVSAAASANSAAQASVAAASAQAAAQVAAGAALTSENNAAASATTAATRASEAATSATQAANASSSAAGAAATASTAATTATSANTAAGNSATAAANSATSASSAATDAVAAAQSSQSAATSAATSAGSASTSATSASGSATTAQGAATTATTQAGIATTAAGQAAASATAAANSATTASSQATAAGVSATSATTAANTATTKAAEATSAATAAANSASTASSASTSAGSSATSSNNSAVSASASATAAGQSAASAGTAASQAQASASAAATSASSASASATAAGQSADAAQSARIAAETASAGASSSASQAANSVTTAQNSAASASQSATLAANASTSASGQAIAANNSAASASASATSANNSAVAAADWYNQTVSATGALSAQVTQEANTRASQISGVHAQLVFKTVATRPDGKRVLGAIGLASTAPNDSTGGQSEILMQADRLVFVPSNDPNADPKQAFVVGSVNGVTTIVVNQAVIGDTTILPRHISTPSLSALVANLGVITAGLIRNPSDTFNIDVNNGRTIARTGAFMKVTGIPFGSANQFLEWFGPYSPNLATCTEANATYFLKTNGQAYFGGTLSAGIIKNSAQTTDTSTTASIVVGPFATNGGSKSVVVSLNAEYSFFCDGTTGFVSGGPGSAVVAVERSISGGGWVQVGTLNATESFREVIGSGGEPGIPDQVRAGISGSTTLTDNTGSTTSLAFRARMTSRSFPSMGGSNIYGPVLTQNISIVSTE